MPVQVVPFDKKRTVRDLQWHRFLFFFLHFLLLSRFSIDSQLLMRHVC